MKYTERVGQIETTYEGTPQEIMDLYNKMNSKKKFMPTDRGSCKPIENPNELKGYNPCQPIDIKPNPTFNSNINVYCKSNIDKIVGELAQNLSKNMNIKGM